MKDPVSEHEKQGEKLNEIFGFLRRAFGSDSKTTPSSFLDAMQRYKNTDSDADCAKMDVGKKLNKKVGGSTGSSSITIGKNTVKNIKGIRFELLGSNGKGTGKFDHAIVSDFKCYDLNADIYGIKWLFDDSAQYEADSISGDLKAGVKNQSVTFMGTWSEGRFYGKFMSPAENWKGGSAEPGSTFGFFNPKTSTKKTTTRKKGKRKTIKKSTPASPSSPTPAMSPASTVSPMTVSSIAPTRTTAGTPAQPTAQTGKKPKIRFTESKTPTMRAFLESFM